MTIEELRKRKREQTTEQTKEKRIRLATENEEQEERERNEAEEKGDGSTEVYFVDPVTVEPLYYSNQEEGRRALKREAREKKEEDDQEEEDECGIVGCHSRECLTMAEACCTTCEDYYCGRHLGRHNCDAEFIPSYSEF